MTGEKTLEELISDPWITDRVIDMESDEREIIKIVERYPNQIEELKLLKSEDIKNKVEGLYSTRDIDFTNRIVKNLELIKISTLVEEQQDKDISIEISSDILEKISLKDIIELETLKEQKLIQISLDLIQQIILEKEEVDCWSEENVEATLAEKFEISTSKIRMINNLTEYINFVSELDVPVNYVSRGQKDCRYDLIPSLHRIYEEDHDIHAEKYESNFKQKMLYYEKDIKNRSNEELRAEGQHYGLPTNYLDFTEAHLISLLFALEDYEYLENHSIVFFIDAVHYNNSAIKREEKLINFDSQEQIKSLEPYNSRSFFIKLATLNERIHFQKGCFLNISVSENKENFKRRLSENCNIAVINKNFKKEILIELFHLGITFENIYPDKDNLVKSIKFNYEVIVGGRI